MGVNVSVGGAQHQIASWPPRSRAALGCQVASGNAYFDKKGEVNELRQLLRCLPERCEGGNTRVAARTILSEAAARPPPHREVCRYR